MAASQILNYHIPNIPKWILQESCLPKIEDPEICKAVKNYLEHWQHKPFLSKELSSL